MLTAAGRDARIGGNIGLGVLGLEDMHGGAVYVFELSSYQLDLTHSLKPDVAILLNITPDHLDRHGDMEGYVAAKRRVLLNQAHGDTAVIGVDDEWCQRICTEITAANRRTIWPISSRRAMGRGVYALLRRALRRHRRAGDRGRRPAPRPLAARPAQLAERRRGLRRRPRARPLGRGRRHRPRHVPRPGAPHGDGRARSSGVRFVNDSKATNADAARQAMSSYPRFYWIAAGGRRRAASSRWRISSRASPRPIWSARPRRSSPARSTARRPIRSRRPSMRPSPPPSPTRARPASRPSSCCRRPAPPSTSTPTSRCAATPSATPCTASCNVP